MEYSNALDKILALIIIVILLVYVPVLYEFRSIDSMTYNLAYTETEHFVDTVTSQGQITKTAYDSFVTSLQQFGAYSVKIEHQAKSFIPDPADPAGYQVVYLSTFQNIIYSDYLTNMTLLPEERIYNMGVEDFVIVTVREESSSYYDELKFMFTGRKNSAKDYIRKVGIVRNEHN